MKSALISSIAVVALTLLLACAPTAAPTPLAPPAPALAAAPALSPEQAAWTKIVEAAKKEGKVNAYAYTWVGDIGITVARAFESRYGIKVDIVTGRGAEFLERLKTEKRVGQQVADMTEGSSLHINNMKLEGLLASVAADLPSLRQPGVWWVDPTAIDLQGKTVLIWRIIEFTPYINTRLVKAGEIPTSWKDILDPKWKGKMTFTEPNLSAGPYQYMVVLMENKAWDESYIKALFKQDLRFPTGLPEEFLALARGENHLAIRGSDASAGRFAMEGAPIQAIDMKEGVVLSTASVAAVAGGPNPNAARVFLNWIYSQEGIAIAAKAQGNKMVRKDIPDFRPPAVQAQITRPLVETIDNLQKATDLFRQKWIDKVVERKAAK